LVHNPTETMEILLDILKQMGQPQPKSVFLKSLHQQYCNRGGLSKKQMEGLYSKALKNPAINQSRLATLEAIIKKKPTRERAAATIKAETLVKDEASGKLIEAILAKYPQHKRVLFLRSKYDQHIPLSGVEVDELKKFGKLLLK